MEKCEIFSLLSVITSFPLGRIFEIYMHVCIKDIAHKDDYRNGGNLLHLCSWRNHSKRAPSRLFNTQRSAWVWIQRIELLACETMLSNSSSEGRGIQGQGWIDNFCGTYIVCTFLHFPAFTRVFKYAYSGFCDGFVGKNYVYYKFFLGRADFLLLNKQRKWRWSNGNVCMGSCALVAKSTHSLRMRV